MTADQDAKSKNSHIFQIGNVQWWSPEQNGNVKNTYMVAVFTVAMGEFLDLAFWSAVMQWTCEFLGDNYGVLQ